MKMAIWFPRMVKSACQITAFGGKKVALLKAEIERGQFNVRLKVKLPPSTIKQLSAKTF